MSIETLTTFLGWCSAINIGLLMFSTIVLVVLRELVTNLHSRLMSIDKSELKVLYFQYLGNYKLAIIMLNLIPYIALKIMAGE